MRRYKVMQQALDVSGYGGVCVEYRALQNSDLQEKYDFIPLILNDFHKGLNIHDIKFYYDRIKQEKPDIVHVRGASVDGLNAVIGAKLAGRTKILLCVHGMYSDLVYYSEIKKRIARYVIEPLSFFLSDGISFVYKGAKDRKNFCRFKKKIVQYVYNRIPDYSSYKIGEERKRFREEYGIPHQATVGIFCGRVSIEKGLTFLAEALGKLQKSNAEEFYMLVVGDGDYLAQFQKDVYQKTSGKINICYTRSMPDVRPALAASDFFIMPSLHENHSIALLEAMAMGLPCVATNVGGNSEIIHSGDFGILVPPFDTEALYDGIMHMLNPNNRSKYRQRIQSYRFHEFSNEGVDKQLDQAYRQVIGLQ